MSALVRVDCAVLNAGRAALFIRVRGACHSVDRRDVADWTASSVTVSEAVAERLASGLADAQARTVEIARAFAPPPLRTPSPPPCLHAHFAQPKDD